MKKCLYFICPTDFLESVIENTFHQESYFLSSLGNSIIFNENVLRHIKSLIHTIGIREVTFILSNDNRIIADALGKQFFSEIRGLEKFYKQMLIQKEHLEMSWQIQNPQFLFLSSFLNEKIEKLKHGLSDSIINEITIHSKIYIKEEDRFKNTTSSLIQTEEIIFN